MILLAVRYEIPATRVKLIKVWQVIRHRSAQVWNERGNAWVETVKPEMTSKCKQTEMHQQHSRTRCDTNSLENQVRKKLCSFLQIDEPPSIFCLWRNDPFWACHTHAQLLYYFLLPQNLLMWGMFFERSTASPAFICLSKFLWKVLLT